MVQFPHDARALAARARRRLTLAAAALVLLAEPLWAQANPPTPPKDFFSNFGSNGPWLREFFTTYPYIAYPLVPIVAVSFLVVIWRIIVSTLRSISETNGGLGRFLARKRIPFLERAGDFETAAKIYLRLDEEKAAADCFFRGKFWKEAADLYFQLNIKLKAARAYEKAGNYSTAAVTFEELGDYEAAERCYRATQDVRAVAKMFSKIGQHRKAAALFREMGLTRDEAEALELGGQHSEALTIWREQLRSYEDDASKLTPLALRERNIIAGHIFTNLEKLNPAEARTFLKGLSQPEGVPEYYQKNGMFQDAARIKELIVELQEELAQEAQEAPPEEEPAASSSAAPGSPRRATPEPGPIPETDPAATSNLALEAQQLMDQGDFTTAGDLFKEAGEFLRAIDAYELALNPPQEGFQGQPLSAWQRDLVERIQWLYERNGSPELAAEFFQRVGLPGQAVDFFLKTGDALRAAQNLEAMGDYETAAQVYQDAGDAQRSIICLALARTAAGDYLAAGDFYAEVGEIDMAASSYDQAYSTGTIEEAQWHGLMNSIGIETAASNHDAPPPPPPQPRPPAPTPSRGYPTGRRGAVGPRRGPGPGPGGPRRNTGLRRQQGIPSGRRRGLRGGPRRGPVADVSQTHMLGGRVPSGSMSGPPPSRRSGVIRRNNATPRMGTNIMPGLGQPGPGPGPGPGPAGPGPGGPGPGGLGPRRRTGAHPSMSGPRPGGRPPGPPPSRTNMVGPRAHGPGPAGPGPVGPGPVGPGPVGPGPVGQGPGPMNPANPGPQRVPTPGTRRNRTVPAPRLRSTTQRKQSLAPSPMEVAEERYRGGDLQGAAAAFESLGALSRARDCYKELNDWAGVARAWQAEGCPYPAGILYFVLGDVEAAVRELTRVPDQDPDSLPARRVAAILYGLMGRFNDARTYFDASFSDTVSDSDIESLYYYGQVLEQNQQTWQDAVEVYHTILELTPQFRDTRQRIGALEQGRPLDPTSIYEDANHDPESLFYVLQESVMAL